MRTKPWHAEGDKWHHDDTDCMQGRKIPFDKRKPGTGDKPLCNECAKLGTARM